MNDQPQEPGLPASESGPPVVVSGKGYTLRLTDSIRGMRQNPTGGFDAAVMDPPYTTAGGSSNGRTSGADDQFFGYWLRDVLKELRRVVKPSGCAFIFCDWRTIGVLTSCMRPEGHRQTEKAWTVSQALVWDRESIGLGSPFRNSYEMIAFARGPEWRSELPKDIPTVLRHRWPYGSHEHHGAEKPVDLCRQLVRWATPAGGLIFDPFMGSGTTGVAALREGRRFTGFEHDRANFDTATKRLRSAHDGIGTSLFDETEAA